MAVRLHRVASARGMSASSTRLRRGRSLRSAAKERGGRQRGGSNAARCRIEVGSAVNALSRSSLRVGREWWFIEETGRREVVYATSALIRGPTQPKQINVQIRLQRKRIDQPSRESGSVAVIDRLDHVFALPWMEKSLLATTNW